MLPIRYRQYLKAHYLSYHTATHTLMRAWKEDNTMNVYFSVDLVPCRTMYMGCFWGGVLVSQSVCMLAAIYMVTKIARFGQTKNDIFISYF